MICAVFVQLDASPVATKKFDGEINTTELGALRASDVVADAQHVERSPRQIARSEDEFWLLSVQVEGEGIVSQDGRSALLKPGDLALYDSTRPYALHFDRSFRQYVFQAPRELLVGRGLDTEHSTARAITGSTGIGAIVSPFLRSLREHAQSVPAAVAPNLAAQAMDLITSACLPWSPGLEPDTVRTLHRQRVLRHIADNFADPDLDIAAIAAGTHLSVRYLHKLFSGAELTVHRSLMRQRLSAAAATLIHPRNADLTISQVASRCGFKTAAHFSHAFREHFGCTPSDYRNA